MERELGLIDLDFSDVLPTAPVEEQNDDEIITESTKVIELAPQSLECDFVTVDEPQSIPLPIQEQVPSAPVFDEPPLQVLCSAPTLLPKYALPALSELQKLHQINAYFVNIAGLKPLSEAELKDLYYNPYLAEAESLENEFVENELHREVRSEKHVLYELLTKYARSRHNLKLTILDINEARVAKHKQFGKLWTESKERVRIYAKCNDGQNCLLTHLYM